MVERNLYLVLINVERYSRTRADRQDLIQEGSMALFRAVDGFDWRRGLLFRTYAVHWLNQAFRNYLYNHGNTVRVPVYIQKALKHIRLATIRIGDPDATPAEIAASADLEEGLVRTAISASRASYSLDLGMGKDEDKVRFRDLLVSPEEEASPYSPRLEDLSLEEGLNRALDRLGARERNVVRLRFGLEGEAPHTLAAVARLFSVSVERIRQIQVRALAKLNTPSLRRELDPFLN
jgi:RNA polymerase sigma factor (sigma-70 family)